MGNEHEIRMVVATTHVDRHGEQFTKEDLEQMAEDAQSSNHPRWLYWNHETTLPPIGHFDVERVELREDGEYQLLSEGILFGEGWSEPANSDNVSGLDITFQEIDSILEPVVLSKDGYLVITYDTINYRGCINKLLDRQRVSRVQISERTFRSLMKTAAYANEFIHT